MKSQILGNGADHSGSSSERFSFNKILQTQETISVGMQVYNLSLKRKKEKKNRAQIQCSWIKAKI